MTLSPWLVYFISRLDSIAYASVFVIIASMMVLTFTGLGVFIIERDIAKKEYDLCLKCFRIFIIPLVCASILRISLPTSKEMCAILILPAIANNENTQEISEELIGLAKEWLKELRPEKVQEQ